MILVENIHNGETFVVKVCHLLWGCKEKTEQDVHFFLQAVVIGQQKNSNC